MDSAKLNDWMQVIGMFALVASLIFVGLQMQQTQAIAIASQYQDRAALNIAGRHANIQNDSAMKLRGEFLLEELSDSSIVEYFENRYGDSAPLAIGYFYMSLKAAQVIMDNNHYQYQSGFLSESAWKAYEVELKESLLNPYYRYIWEDTKHEYRAEFQILVGELIRQNDANL